MDEGIISTCSEQQPTHLIPTLTSRNGRYVLWPRIDQKTCAKAVVSAGMELVPIAMRLQGDALVTDVDAVRSKIAELGADNVMCVLSTTSCFAPRTPDAVADLVRLTAQLLTHPLPPSYLPLSALCWTYLAPPRRVWSRDVRIQADGGAARRIFFGTG